MNEWMKEQLKRTTAFCGPDGRFMRTLRSRWLSIVCLTLACGIAVACLVTQLRRITITDEGHTTVITAPVAKATDVLKSAGIAVNRDDEIIDCVSSTPSRIEINRAFNVNVTVNREKKVVRMTGGTVATALKEAGLDTSLYKPVNLNANTAVMAGMNITVGRQFTYAVKTEQTPVAFVKTSRYTDTMNAGESKVEQVGRNGAKKSVYKETMFDGKVVDRELLSEELVKEPVNQVTLIGIGTGNAISTFNFNSKMDENGIPASYSKVITGSGTAYTSTGNAHTSTGRVPTPGCVAVDPRKIPYGSKLYIVSADGKYVYGYAIACDTGGAARQGRIVADLYMNSYDQCVQFGRRQIKIYVLS